jgi:hypothetical protein
MHAVSSSTAAASEPESFSFANATPGRSGSKAARFCGCPVTESAPSVRPWKEFSSATMRVLPVAFLAYLIAASIASAPELQKNACAPPKRSDRSAASCVIGSVQ